MIARTLLGLIAMTCMLGPSDVFGEPRALLVGIDRYQEPTFSFAIPGASKADVSDIRSLLLDEFGFKERQIKTLLDEQATHDAILTEIRGWLGDDATRGENVFFFYVGHGHFTEDESGDETADGFDEAIVPYDARLIRSATELGVENLIIDDELGKAFSELTGRQVTAVFDSCNSGTVTRALNLTSRFVKTARTLQLSGRTRSLRGLARVQAQKKEGGFFDFESSSGSLTVWSAVSAVQLALIDTERPSPFGGVFTGAFTEGARGAADRNGNGIVSHAELYAYVSEKSEAYCLRHKSECELGLTPRLDQLNGNMGTPILPISPGSESSEPNDRELATLIEDYLAKGNTHRIELEQIPASPVQVGTKDVRFRVRSPRDGQLILLTITDDGKIVHLFPNQHVEHGGLVRANNPITVPDDFYGMRINADSPSSGYVFAIVASKQTLLPEELTGRLLSVVAAEDLETEYLQPLATALGSPTNEGLVEENTQAGDWSVAKLRYSIVE